MKLVKLSVFLFAITLVVSSCSTQNSNKMLITYDVPRSMPEVFVINKKDSAESTYSHRIKSGDRIAVKFLNNVYVFFDSIVSLQISMHSCIVFAVS